MTRYSELIDRLRFDKPSSDLELEAANAIAQLAQESEERRPPPGHPFDGKFEEEARDCRDPLSAAATSIAVSLKRIADVLENNLGDNSHCYATTLLGLLHSIEMNGRS